MQSCDSSDIFDTNSSPLPHNKLFAIIDNKIESLIKNDPLLCHLPQDVAVSELEDLIGHQSGHKIAVWLQIKDSPLRVIVDSNANVGQLKQSIRKWFTLDYKRSKDKKKININWKYVWKSYCLVFDDHKLTDDSIAIKCLGIVNKSNISFTRITFKK